MKLACQILWFDDQPNNVAPSRERISSALSRLGFTPKITTQIVVEGGPDPMLGLPGTAEVDLILMDWKLGGGVDGADLARQVRRIYRYTDIVFYSSAPPRELRSKIVEKDIDGVYCVNRENLGDRTIGIIKVQLRKVLDLNHMRGLMMAATSDLDHAMTGCIEAIQKIAYTTDAGPLALVISEKVAAELRAKAEKIERWGRNGKLDKLLRDPNFGAAMRHALLKDELKKLVDKIDEIHLLEKLDAYLEDVITPRNRFAHRRVEVIGDEMRLEGDPTPINQEVMTGIRLKLLDHSENLHALLSLLGELALSLGEQHLAEKLEDAARAVEQVQEVASEPASLVPPAV